VCVCVCIYINFAHKTTLGTKAEFCLYRVTLLDCGTQVSASYCYDFEKSQLCMCTVLVTKSSGPLYEDGKQNLLVQWVMVGTNI